jgi:hypothetical protein
MATMNGKPIPLTLLTVAITIKTVAITSEGAFLWVLTAPLLLFMDSVVFSIEQDNFMPIPTIILRLGQK